MWYEKTAMILAAIGAINWGLVALLEWNLVELFSVSWLITTVYVLVAVSGIYALIQAFR